MKKIYSHIDKIERQLESIKDIIMKSANENILQTRSKDSIIEKDINKDRLNVQIKNN